MHLSFEGFCTFSNPPKLLKQVLKCQPLQKQAQLSLEEHLATLDNVLMYQYLRPKLESTVDGTMLQALDDSFAAGQLLKIRRRFWN